MNTTKCPAPKPAPHGPRAAYTYCLNCYRWLRTDRPMHTATSAADIESNKARAEAAR